MPEGNEQGNQQDQGGQGGGKPTDVPKEYKDFGEFIGEQPEAVRTLFEAHESGLKSALGKERDEKEALSKQIKELSKATGDNEALKGQLDTVAAALDESNRRADFFAAAALAGITGSDIELAYVAATKDGLFDRKGQPDIPALKEKYPKLFTGGTPGSGGGAGAGRRQAPPKAEGGMDAFIRGAAKK